MTMVVTGGAGFLGASVIRRLLADGHADTRIRCLDRVPCPIDDARVVSVCGSIGRADDVRQVITADVTAIWHLAAVLSGQSEAEPDEAMAVNVEGTRTLLEACRALTLPPRFVFASTVAVFGGPLPDVVSDDFALRPQSTYGVSKAIAELLVLEATRRGAVEGVVCRVPTVAIRPGRPNSALSSFVSGIVREPLAGEPAVCPVPETTPLWVASPDVTTHNLVHAARLPVSRVPASRTINLPGVTVTPAALLSALERIGGAAARARVRVEPDPHVAAIVRTWPAAFDVGTPTALGFLRDADADAIVDQYDQAQRMSSGDSNGLT